MSGMLRTLWFPALAALIVGLWAYTRFVPEPTVEMPAGVADEAERELYLTPGGKYTEADIAANGRTTASQRYRGFQANHDLRPRPGDRVCPITRTRADPRCTWMIDGKNYLFCCPPCIDEFVRLAKDHPGDLRPPDAYVQR